MGTEDEIDAVESDGATGGVQRLGPGMSGHWRVLTRGTVQVWDLDRRTCARLPGADSSAFGWDGVEAPILSVNVWRAVGESFFVFFQDPDEPLIEQWRISSRVRSIESDE